MIQLSLLFFNLLFIVDKKKHCIKYHYDEIIIIPLMSIIGPGAEIVKYFTIRYNNGKIRIDVFGVWHSKKNKDCSYYYSCIFFFKKII